MKILLVSDWESKIPKTARVYPLGDDAKKVVDATFDNTLGSFQTQHRG